MKHWGYYSPNTANTQLSGRMASCPAVNMFDVLTKTLMTEEELAGVLDGNPARLGSEHRVVINRQFLKGLKEAHIRKLDYQSYAEDDILFFHGTQDAVVPMEACRTFAEKNGIRFIPVENAAHNISNWPNADVIYQTVLEFFAF